MNEPQVIQINPDGTALGILRDKVFKGVPVKVPLRELSFIELRDEGTGITVRIRHWKEQIYSTVVLSREEVSREIENDMPNNTGLSDLSRKHDELGHHTFFEWREMV